MTEPHHDFGPFRFDRRRRLLFERGSPVALGHRASALLETLLAAGGQVVPKSELMQAAWQTENIEESNLAVQIAGLRKRLRKSSGDHEWIRTISRVGYQFVPVETSETSAPNGANPTVPAAEKPSVAVLPFENLSNDPEQRFLSDGISADILTELTRWRLLSVRPRSASFRFRGAPTDLRSIAEALKVDYVVEGSVQRRGEGLRIAVQLIDTESGNQVWADRFDRTASELFVLQDEVVRTIVSTLVGRVEAAAVERVSRKAPASLAAYECVLRGNALPWDDPSGTLQAVELFTRAIELDPDYGFAHAMLAVMRFRSWIDDLPDSDQALIDADRLSMRAVYLDRNDSTCFSIRSFVCALRRSFDLAIQFMQRALELNPSNQWNAANRGVVLMYADQAEAALDAFHRAKEIDPYFHPPWYSYFLGKTYMTLRRYEDALAEFERLANPSYRATAQMAGCHARLGNLVGADEHAKQCLRARPEFTISRFMSREPFKGPAQAKHLAQSLRMAGLPE